MALPQITVTIDPPLVSDTPEQFNIKAFTAWQTLAQLTPQVNAWSIQVDAAGVVTLQAKADAQAAATSANASKDAAAASAASASGSATSANASKDAAAASATAAANSASSATTSKDAAAASATTASNAATSATDSKNAAAASASAAAASASAASSSKDAAAASASAAAASAASVAGGPVASVNGATGIVTLKTVEGVQLDGTGNIVVDVAAKVHAATAKTTPIDADELGLADSAESWTLKKLTFANLKAWISSLFVSRTSAQVDGNLNISGTGRRITGDFSNGVIANRVAFQTNVANSITVVEAIPSGTGSAAQFNATTSSDPNNASTLQMRAGLDTGDARIASMRRGTGAHLPLTFHTSDAERIRIATNGFVGIGTNTPRTVLEVNGPLLLDRTDAATEGGELAFARASDNSTAFTLDVYGAGSTPNLRILNAANGSALPFYINGVTNNIGFSTSTANARLQLDNAIDPNGYDVGKIRFYEGGGVICGIGVSSGQVNYRAHIDHVMYSGTNEVARIGSGGSLTLGYQLRVGQSYSLLALPNATNWLRLCTFPANNQPRYVRFLLWSTAHDNWLVEFSPGAGGDLIRAKVTLLGAYEYFSIYPLQWRIVREGTNGSCHIDIKFGGSTEIRSYSITVLESFSSTGAGATATFPCINVGTSANGGAGTSWGVQLGTTGGLTYREVELVPGYYARLGNDLARTNGAIPADTVVV